MHQPTNLQSLRDLRQNAVLKQDELADRSEINRVTLSLIENGRVQASVPVIRKLAVALGLAPADVQTACNESFRQANA